MKQMKWLVGITTLFLLFGCSEQPSEKVIAYQENREIIGPEKDEIIGDISDSIYESINRDNPDAEEIIIGPIEGTGEDIILPEGRYMIIPGASFDGVPSSGRVVVHDEEGNDLLNEVLDAMNGVQSVTVDVNGSHTVHVDGLEEAIITPVATNLSNELTAGIWEVGLDIEAGKYSVFPNPELSFNVLGDLMIFEKGKSPRLFEILNTTEDSPIVVELKEGQKIKISNISYLKFEPLG